MALPDVGFDVALCAIGLMYMPEPEQAQHEMRRVLTPGERLGLAGWGGRSLRLVRSISHRRRRSGQRGVSAVFRLGQEGVLARLCEDAGFQAVTQHRISATLNYVDADHACDPPLLGGQLRWPGRALITAHASGCAHATFRRSPRGGRPGLTVYQ
ncbi:MAG: hypothetical protein H7224_10070 [Polaromonas sp.]|nr:hypothetical protein [Polaromonas sp.]